jgi:hypothetical protein
MVSPRKRIQPNSSAARSPRHAGSSRLRNWMIFVAFVAMGGVVALAGLLPALFSKGSSATAREPASDGTSTAAIAPSETRFCKRLRFDDIGRAFQDVVPCDGESARDARGQPVPVGTIRRLDAISKSFFGH